MLNLRHRSHPCIDNPLCISQFNLVLDLPRQRINSVARLLNGLVDLCVLVPTESLLLFDIFCFAFEVLVEHNPALLQLVVGSVRRDRRWIPHLAYSPPWRWRHCFRLVDRRLSTQGTQSPYIADPSL